MNYNSREDENNNRDRTGGNPGNRQHARPRDGIDMDVLNARQGQSNRQWGADRYESNPYGSRNFEERGRSLSDNRDEYTQDSTHKTGFMEPYNMGRSDFANREYNYNDYNGNDWRREHNDKDYGSHQAPDQNRGYQNFRSRFNNNHFASGDRSNFAGGQGQSGSSHYGNELWSHRMSGRDQGGGFNRMQSGQGHTYGQNFGQSQSQRSHRDFGGSRDFSDRGYNDNDHQQVYDRGNFKSQFQHDRELYGAIPGFGSARGEHFGKGPKGYKRADARIQEEVCDALYHDPNVDASEIEVSVKDGVVTLAGSVPERRMKRMAEECVEHLSGVHDVRNQISTGGLFSNLFGSGTDKHADKPTDSKATPDKASKSNMM